MSNETQVSRGNDQGNNTAGMGSITQPINESQSYAVNDEAVEPCEPECEPECTPEEGEASIQSQPMREIHIKPLNYGFNVTLGCSTFAVETKASLIKKLTAYINDPSGVESKWHRTGEL